MRQICVLLALLGALAAPGSAAAYSWPLKPFDQQHPIRAYFDDPRLLFGADSFHFGIDICAADGSPVYAVAPGVVHVHSDNLAITMDRFGADPDSGFSKISPPAPRAGGL